MIVPCKLVVKSVQTDYGIVKIITHKAVEDSLACLADTAMYGIIYKPKYLKVSHDNLECCETI
jgi:hypothetical protein